MSKDLMYTNKDYNYNVRIAFDKMYNDNKKTFDYNLKQYDLFIKYFKKDFSDLKSYQYNLYIVSFLENNKIKDKKINDYLSNKEVLKKLKNYL